jgi:hypothetical protein
VDDTEKKPEELQLARYIVLHHLPGCRRLQSSGLLACSCKRQEAAERLRALIGSGFGYEG